MTSFTLAASCFKVKGFSRKFTSSPASIRRPSQQGMAAVRSGEDVWAPRSMAGADVFGAGPPSAEVWTTQVSPAGRPGLLEFRAIQESSVLEVALARPTKRPS